MAETRTNIEKVELREGVDGQPVAFGYASRFNTYSQNLGGFVERVAPGTFTKTILEADIRGLFNHDANLLLGRNRANTLRLAEDDNGLAYSIDLPDTTTGRDVRTLLKRGDVTGSSFGFRTIDDEWGETEDGFPLRTLKSVALRDVGPVTFPAYVEAESGLRSLAESRNLDPTLVIEAAKANQLGELLRTDIVIDDGAGNITVLGNEPEDDPAGTTPPVKSRFRFMA